MPDFITTPQVAAKLGKPEHVVAYAIRRYAVEPTTRIGNVRVWDEAGVERVRYAVKRIESNKP